MGLSIHIALSLKPGYSPRGALDALRQRCMDLPFVQVDGALRELNANGDHETDEFSRMLCIHAGTVGEDTFTGEPPDEAEAVGFVAFPGNGCEPLLLGLAKARGSERWRWRTACKTQYANAPAHGGRVNFLRCHLSIIALLDAAPAIGLSVDVVDEGDYWLYRDVHRLDQKLTQYDAMIAGAIGALKDASVSVQAPLLSRPDFERLEADGNALFTQQIRELVRLTALDRIHKRHATHDAARCWSRRHGGGDVSP